MNLYQIVETATGTVVITQLGYNDAVRYMQKNRLNKNEYSIELWMHIQRKRTN